ncbi:MAG: NADH:quinone oxidoreductase subunit A [Candidatus Westeberhardia cardiocondylae]|nr:NADH:quinone oxidoreductase subunit A [Candidatus Westeberhardia cardiocondylae]
MNNCNSIIEQDVHSNVISLITLFTISLILCTTILFISFFLGERNNYQNSHSRNIPFESGVNPVEKTRFLFSIKFYLIAVAFVIFDIESLYIYTWSIVINEANWIGLIEIIIFIINLLIGLLYLIKKDVLNWAKITKNKQYK